VAELADYQCDIIDDFQPLVAGGSRSILMVAPTSSDNAVIPEAIVGSAVAAAQRVVILTHPREIIDGTVSKLTDLGIGPEVTEAGFAAHPGAALPVPGAQPLLASLEVWEPPTGFDQRARGAV
jgi:hypothetical protein